MENYTDGVTRTMLGLTGSPSLRYPNQFSLAVTLIKSLCNKQERTVAEIVEPRREIPVGKNKALDRALARLDKAIEKCAAEQAKLRAREQGKKH